MRQGLVRVDRKRKKKGSSNDWFNPSDPDAKIEEDEGRTTEPGPQTRGRPGHRCGRGGDDCAPIGERHTATFEGTLDAAVQNLDDERERAGDEPQREGQPEEAVADKGYHSKMVLPSLQQEGWRTYIAELNVVGRDGRSSRPSETRCAQIGDARTDVAASR